MTVLYVLLLAVVQGITEFLPVSSFGHIALIEQALGMDGSSGVLLAVMLHIGTLAAVVLTFYKDLNHIVVETGSIIKDLFGNFRIYYKNRHSDELFPYHRIFSSTYRKFTVMIWVSMIPTALLGFTVRRLVDAAAVSKIFPAAGLLVTGIVLLVIDFSCVGGKKAAKDITFSNAMWLGICQGISAFPGLSRSGLTISAGLMSGFSRSFAVKYSYIMSIPAIIGAFFVECPEFVSADMDVALVFIYILGLIVSAVVGYFAIHYLLKLVHKGKFRFFAIYCFVIGILALVFNYM